MIFLLFSIITGTIVLLYYFFNKIITTPCIMACMSFWIILLFDVFFGFFLEFDINFNTVSVILGCLLAIIIGNFVGEKIIGQKKVIERKLHSPFRIGNKLFIIYVIVTVLALYITYSDFLVTAAMFNVSGNPELTYYFVREASLNGEDYHTFGVPQYMIINDCLSSVIIFCIAYNAVFFGWRKYNNKLLIPVVFSLMNAILTGGRTGLIIFAYYAICDIGILLMIKYKHDKDYINKMFIRKIFGSFTGFLAIFFLLGFLRLGGDSNVDWLMLVFKYLGASIPALDQYLDGAIMVVRYPEWFGANSLFGIYKSLEMLGVYVPHLYAPAEFVYVAGDSTNIYTAIMRYINDFGFVSTIIIFFMCGMLYGWGHKNIIYNERIGFSIILYTFLSRPLCELAIEERLFMNIISISSIELLMVMYLIYVFFIRNVSYK